MKDYLISLFLDDELRLDEKREFMNAVAFDEEFRREAIELLAQENLLRAGMVTKEVPAPVVPFVKRLFFEASGLKAAFAGLAVAVLLIAALFRMQSISVSPQPAAVVPDVPHRFVLYLPEANEAAVVGSFSGWTPIPMQKIDDTGYWALDMELAPGEHRYSYLVENVDRMIDPTIAARERDDFGGENSIITVGVSI